ncbi:hypothetical protein B0H19DRAFT_178000 [Mycena capillaripes]|nr:hypothetical protein B0H19DRAFT_178000 [Mycena capillaripes]
MKSLTSLALIAILATTAFAQSAVIGAPADGITVLAGSNITVEVDRPNTLTGSTEIAVVIGIFPCSNSVCPGPSEALGTILYDGSFNPQFQNDSRSKPPHQNFTVTIPSSFRTGKAQLGVAHFTLIGAGQFPFLETLNVTLNVVQS